MKFSDTNYNWKGKTILIVEDDEPNYRYFEIVLKETNARVLWSKNGRNAVDICCSSGEKIDLVIMDILIPLITGIEATRIIKKHNKDIPVIAAGGIYTGADIHKIMQLGAQAVQMGTRFVTTDECDADVRLKNAFLNCKKEDIVIINSPVGLPGRAITDEFLERVSSGVREVFTCPWKCLKSCDFKNVPYCIALALTNAKKGNMEGGFAFAGANAYRVNKIISVKELIGTLVEEYMAVVMQRSLAAKMTAQNT